MDSFLSSVFFLNANLGWAIGGEGTVIRTIDGGENWRPQRCESYYNLNSIYMADAETGWIVGDLGVMLRYVVDD